MDVFSIENLNSLESKTSNPREIALLRFESLENVNDGGFASSFVPMLRDSMNSWFDSSMKSGNTVMTRDNNGCKVAEEKKEDINVLTPELSFFVKGTVETDILYRVLTIYVNISRVDPTLAEELGRQGSHLVLSRLIRYDGAMDFETEEDQDTIIELQDLACEIATQAGGSFPVKCAPLTPDDLRSRLPLRFTITAPNKSDQEKEETITADEQVVLINQVTARRQSAQEDVGFVMWPSAVALSKWLIANPNSILGKSVVELGSGCGLTGLVAAGIQSNGGPDFGEHSVTLTDFNPTVLENAQRNISLNDLDHVATTSELDFYKQSGTADRWLDGTGDSRDQVDVVLAADMICQPDDSIAAANALHDTLKPGGIAFSICADSKHRFGVDSFAEQCKRAGLIVETTNVADMYDGNLLCEEGMNLTSGYVEGMTLTFFSDKETFN